MEPRDTFVSLEICRSKKHLKEAIAALASEVKGFIVRESQVYEFGATAMVKLMMTAREENGSQVYFGTLSGDLRELKRSMEALWPLKPDAYFVGVSSLNYNVIEAVNKDKILPKLILDTGIETMAEAHCQAAYRTTREGQLMSFASLAGAWGFHGIVIPWSITKEHGWLWGKKWMPLPGIKKFVSVTLSGLNCEETRKAFQDTRERDNASMIIRWTGNFGISAKEQLEFIVGIA